MPDSHAASLGDDTGTEHSPQPPQSNGEEQHHYHYDLSAIFAPGQTHNSVLLLNRPITPLSLFEAVWRNADRRVCADGAANHLFDGLMNAHGRRERGGHEGGEGASLVDEFMPDAIVGDLDSIRDDVRSWYSARNVEIVHDGDQYSTDFAKSLRHVYWLSQLPPPHANNSSQPASQHSIATESRHERAADPAQQTHNVVVLGSLAGRVDQGIGVLHELYRETRRFVPGTAPLLGAEGAAAKMNDFRPAAVAAATAADAAAAAAASSATHEGGIAGDDARAQQTTKHQLWLVSEQNVSLCLPPGTSTLAGLFVRNQHPSSTQPSTTTTAAAAAAADETSSTGTSTGTGSPQPTQRAIFAKHCGILPVFGPATISTRGLEWDVHAWPTRMGGRVSSSNHVVAERVEVSTDAWVLFTVAFDAAFLEGMS